LLQTSHALKDGFNPGAEVMQFLSQNNAFMSENIGSMNTMNSTERAYWYQTSLVLQQIAGIYEGYQAARGGMCTCGDG
jgi:hypothetical protein